jgi:general secretion pathway protein A
MQVEERFLLNVHLVGQPELADHLKNHPQLDQRITVKFHLERFDHQDTANYIKYRLSIAGCDKELFSDAALYLIHAISKGVARRINNLCGLCLLEGANQKTKIIDEEIIKQVF